METAPAQRQAAILFADIESGPVSGNQDEQYIQLLNPHAIAVDISGWTLTTGDYPDVPLFTFRGGTVIPAHGTLYVAAHRPAFRARRVFPTGGQSLFVTGDCIGRLAGPGTTLELTDREGLKIAFATALR